MTWTKRKTNAYSLSEVLVALLISILVMGFMLFSLRYFQQLTQEFGNRIGEKNQMVRMEQVVWNDIHEFSGARPSVKDSSFILIHPMKQVQYSFKNRQIIRNQQLLLSNFTHLRFFYEGQPVQVGRFDALELTVIADAQQVNYFFSFPKSVQLYAP